MKRAIFAAAAVLLGVSGPALARQDPPAASTPVRTAQAAERVTFRSMDEPRTELVGYLFRPAGGASRDGAPAVVLMHGRGGVYSSQANGVYAASTLTRRLRFWAEYWTERGFYVLIVDSFGPRGYPTGFAAGTYSTRPPEVNEVTIRPLDAYGAMRFLRSLDGVADDRIGLMGFSNGASATLAALADDKPGDMRRLGFRAGVALYPGCGLQNRFARGYRPYAPVQVFVGTADEEVSPESCRRLVDRARAAGEPVELTVYEGAVHGFDDPSRSRQAVPANAAATADVRRRVGAFFEAQLAPR
ncbi:dienelactone hydrolase family protein [Brevundimonas sp. SORGH_AS_0993]|uniref:dienelactone hydrolase family protein n=1 Tax=Brevundimonas sp. SORGH_AS_0993 TaxID=3041794 RepID=UPI00277DCBC9|nr:dienelactone hydrolase family protein [Brevundimonas sp. SORGH_AS_0993]MDQ1154800.1 dienelactone hydrolase [Brevundimonas sp. SORGH_AS_0993]